jgi:hypothetical protein
MGLIIEGQLNSMQKLMCNEREILMGREIQVISQLKIVLDWTRAQK